MKELDELLETLKKLQKVLSEMDQMLADLNKEMEQ